MYDKNGIILKPGTIKSNIFKGILIKKNIFKGIITTSLNIMCKTDLQISKTQVLRGN